MSRRRWSARFDFAIPIDAGELATLADAIAWLANLPKARHTDDEVQLAARLVTWAAEEGGIVLMAEYAVRRVVFAGRPAAPVEPRRKRAKAYRIISGTNAKKAPPPGKGKRGLSR